MQRFALHELLQHIRIADIFDVAVVAVLVYIGLRWVRQRTSWAVALGVLLVAALYVSAHLLGMYLTLSAFHIGFTILLLAWVIVFQQDIRHAFEQLSTWHRLGRNGQSASAVTVEVLMEAIATLAKEKIGALIVLRGHQPLDQHVRGGVEVGAQVSLPLMHSIFHPASQGHDGAIVIAGNLIEKLGVHLPLSMNMREVAGTGTRHTAALGLAERCDALIVIVSEERGTISFARNSRLKQLGTAADLKQTLSDFCDEHSAATARQPRLAWLTSHLGLKVMALATACMLWFLLVFNVETIQRTFSDVPIELRQIPDGWVVQDTHPSVAQVTLSGPEQAFTTLVPADLKISVDLEDLHAGAQSIPLTTENLTIPVGLTIERLDTSVVQVHAEPLVRVELPVKITLEDPGLLQVRGLVAVSQPARVQVLVPESAHAQITEIQTENIPTSSVVVGLPVDTKLVLPPAVKLAAGTDDEVKIRFQPQSPPQPASPP